MLKMVRWIILVHYILLVFAAGRSDLSMSVTQEKKGQLENSMKKLTVSISEAKVHTT